MPIDPLPGVPPRQPLDRAAGESGRSAVSQVAACRRWVSELQASLALFEERCGGLEEAHSKVVSSQNKAVPKLQELVTEHAKIMAAIHQMAAFENVNGSQHATPSPNQIRQTHMQEEPPRCGAGAAPAPASHLEEPLPPRQCDGSSTGGLRFHDVQAVGNMLSNTGGSGYYASTAAPSTQAEAIPAAVNSNATTVPEPEKAATDASAAAIRDMWTRHYPSRGGSSGQWRSGSTPASPRPTCEYLSTPGSGTWSSAAPNMGPSAMPCSFHGSVGGLTEPVAVQWPSMENWWQPSQSSAFSMQPNQSSPFSAQPAGAMQFSQPLQGCTSWPSSTAMLDRIQPPPLPPLAPPKLNGWGGGLPPLSFVSAGVAAVSKLLQ